MDKTGFCWDEALRLSQSSFEDTDLPDTLQECS